MFCRADEKVFEIAQSVRTQHIAFVARDKPANGRFSGEYVKVILPKIDHYFLQLTFGVNRS